MDFDKEKVIERIKQANEYGLKYTELAKSINVAPVSIYLFLSGNYNMTKIKQLKALCYVEKFIEQTIEELKQVDPKGVYII